jgi:hypothetical protein
MPNIWINAPNQTVQNAYESAGSVGNDPRITWTKDGIGIQQARFDVIQNGIQYRVEVVAQHLPGGGSVIKTQIFENGIWRLITHEDFQFTHQNAIHSHILDSDRNNSAFYSATQ